MAICASSGMRDAADDPEFNDCGAVRSYAGQTVRVRSFIDLETSIAANP